MNLRNHLNSIHMTLLIAVEPFRLFAIDLLAISHLLIADPLQIHRRSCFYCAGYAEHFKGVALLFRPFGHLCSGNPSFYTRIPIHIISNEVIHTWGSAVVQSEQVRLLWRRLRTSIEQICGGYSMCFTDNGGVLNITQSHVSTLVHGTFLLLVLYRSYF